jgi:hypothetical protein
MRLLLSLGSPNIPSIRINFSAETNRKSVLYPQCMADRPLVKRRIFSPPDLRRHRRRRRRCRRQPNTMGRLFDLLCWCRWKRLEIQECSQTKIANVQSVHCFPHHQPSALASSMIGSLFILNDKGSVLFEKHYRRVSSRACCEDFWRMIERKAGEQVCFHAPSAPFPSTVAESLPHMLCSTAAPCCPRRLPCVPPPPPASHPSPNPPQLRTRPPPRHIPPRRRRA